MDKPFIFEDLGLIVIKNGVDYTLLIEDLNGVFVPTRVPRKNAERLIEKLFKREEKKDINFKDFDMSVLSRKDFFKAFEVPIDLGLPESEKTAFFPHFPQFCIKCGGRLVVTSRNDTYIADDYPDVIGRIHIACESCKKTATILVTAKNAEDYKNNIYAYAATVFNAETYEKKED